MGEGIVERRRRQISSQWKPAAIERAGGEGSSVPGIVDRPAPSLSGAEATLCKEAVFALGHLYRAYVRPPSHIRSCEAHIDRLRTQPALLLGGPIRILTSSEM